ncbi:MAG: FAD/NAD(P)-binding protein [Planctomycetaceae bacterium]|nr:FAD/NAD(P)-binding protein [Planctomycetaceae bacterium]
MNSPSSSTNRACHPWVAQVAVVTEVRQEIESVATYRLRLRDAEIARQYRFQPGQFNMLYVPGCGESAISHSGPSENDGHDLWHTVRFVGRVTDSIAKLNVGDHLGVRGPFGTAWPLEACKQRDVVVMSGGLGLAPLRPMLYALMAKRSEFGRVVLLHGARTPETILYPEELSQWQAQGIEVELTVDRADGEWAGNVGVVPLLLDRLPDLRPAQTEVVTCGPEIMMHFSAISALKRGIPETSIWLSMERNMQCAAGLCGHCQWGPLFVCKDGPVFRYDRIRTLLKVRDL